MMLGTDPEVFVTSGGKLLPAYEFLPEKSKAKSVTNGDGAWAKLFWDGFQAEYTTYGHTCLAFLVDDIQCGLQGIRDAARVHHPYAELSINSVVEIPKAIRRAAAMQHVILGCDPSRNVYGMHGEEVLNGRELMYRFSGGHVHFGTHYDDVEEIVRTLDAILGVWAVGAARNLDNPIRRRYYGLAGEFRLPQHGIEYRTLSNFWLCHPAIAHLTFEIARGALKFAVAHGRKAWEATDREVVEVINNSDVAGAEAILRRNSLRFFDVLSNADVDAATAGFQVGLKGVEAVILNPQDLAGNWRLNGAWKQHSDSPNCDWGSASEKMIAGARV